MVVVKHIFLVAVFSLSFLVDFPFLFSFPYYSNLFLFLSNCLAFLVSSIAIFSFSCVFSFSSTSQSVKETVLLFNAGFLFLFDFLCFGKTSNSLKIPHDDDEPVRVDL